MKYIILFILLLCPVLADAAAITSAQSGNWSDTATWTGGVDVGAVAVQVQNTNRKGSFQNFDLNFGW